MISSCILLPFEVLVHECTNPKCSQKLSPFDIIIKNKKLTIHPLTFVGDKIQSNFPRPRLKDIKILNKNYDKIITPPTIGPKYKDIISTNSFIIDYFEDNVDEVFQDDLIAKLIKNLKVITSQYWINTDTYNFYKIYDIFTIVYPPNYNPQIGQLTSNIINTNQYPVEIKSLTQTAWENAFKNIINNIFLIDDEYFIDSINNLHHGYIEKFLLNLCISLEWLSSR